MKTTHRLNHILGASCLILLFLLITATARAQCTNWGITARLVTASTCAGNGSIQVTITGPDGINLTNIQYGIPINANGFSLPLNGASTLTGIPPGTYTVSAVAFCGGSYVGKNTTIEVPGNYRAPSLVASQSMPSLGCRNSGAISAYANNGLAPYTFQLINAGNNGVLRTASVTTAYVSFDSLAAGSYRVYMVDACGSSTYQAVTIDNVNSVAMPNLTGAQFYALGCDSFTITHPGFNSNAAGYALWSRYADDTALKISMRISGGLLAQTPFIPLASSEPVRRLPVGKTLKDYYGKTIIYTVHRLCGGDVTDSSYISYPGFSVSYNQNCNTDFTALINFSSNMCTPITYTIRSLSGGASYGPTTTAIHSVSTPLLPIGDYEVSFRTADGYTGSDNLSTAFIPGNPYSVTIGADAKGLHNYIEKFQFSSNTTATGQVIIELFNGPAGYTYYGNAPRNPGIFAVAGGNSTPVPGKIFFPPGNYVWKLTDNCGTYFLPINVSTSDLYQFTVGVAATEPTCMGLKVTPTGTAFQGGSQRSIYFSVLKDGFPFYAIVNNNSVWMKYALGQFFYVTEPGTYTILTAAEPNQNLGELWLSNPYQYGGAIAYPNIYTQSYSFTYAGTPLQVDINHSQGFLCKGGGLGQGKIFASALGGIPFSQPTIHYNYSLAAQGQGNTGPYMAQNTTGIFTGFGGSTNNVYDLKVTDTCGYSVIQSLKILDLGTSRIAASNHYAACSFDSIQLSAIYLPGATYSWTGPGGFSSTSRTPVIPHASTANIGVYYVTVTTSECNQSIRDSTVLSLNPQPPRPLVSLDCGSMPASLTITNPQGGIEYAWDIRYGYYSDRNFYREESDTLFSKEIYVKGAYVAVAIDTNTGCTSASDTMDFPIAPYRVFRAGIYAVHPNLCPGDTTTLVAQINGAANAAARFQWYKNNVPIAGATAITLIVNTAGSYKVSIQSPPCNADTSAPVVVNIVPPPTATITAPTQQICEGDTAYINGNTGAGYAYTWHLNANTVPGVFGPVLPAYASGDYYATVSNGACVANSNTIHINVNAAPIVRLLPDSAQLICAGDSVSFSTQANAGYGYRWQRNGITIAGANSNTFKAGLSGNYRVIVSTSTCPNVISATVPLTVLPTSIQLRNDTTICNNDPFAILLSAGAGFDSYLWSDGGQTNSIMATAAGTYWVRATNKCGTVTATVHIHSLYEYLPHFPKDTTICNPSNLTILQVPKLLQQCVWNTGDTGNSLAIRQPGRYWVTGISPCGVVSDTTSVRFCSPKITSINLLRDSICEGDCIFPTATVQNYPQTYHWVFTGTTQDTSDLEVPAMLCYPLAGTYPITLTVTNAGGSDTYTTQLIVQKKPQPRFADTSMVISYKTSLTLPACAAAQKIDWYRDGILVCSNCTSINIEARDYRTVYHCVVSNGDCKDSCLYKMQVIDIPHDVWLPDAFTPNGDGRNDAFHIITDNPNVYGVELSVYNRWGQKVYISHTTMDGWDGRINGADADLGNYFWTLKYKVLGTEESFFKKGDLVLVR